MGNFKPEGNLFTTEENKYYLKSVENLREAIHSKKILEAKTVVCDVEHNLIVDLQCCRGFIKREEGAIGIDDGTTRDIALLTRVNKLICFRVTDIVTENGEVTAILSRKLAQTDCLNKYLNRLKSGAVISAKTTHFEQFGVFVDIGCGVPSLLPIDSISVSRISHPSERFSLGQDIKVIYKGKEDERFLLTHKELLGTWLENAERFNVGETVTGIVRSIEDYGVFIELTPNLVGLAEPTDNVKVNQEVTVFIKSIIPDKMKVKLIIVASSQIVTTPTSLKYFCEKDVMTNWEYSTAQSIKTISTNFV
ncbi:MAG: S1 RNA-binding domain-containing protein [Oscillospiraceae bacterium]|jgi:small subunit ribosomal protein S1|nr:S1 RNA-binding domain-containing protein [Oscillospiraceae bacterium]